MIFNNTATAFSNYLTELENIINRINLRISKFEEFQTVSTEQANAVILKAQKLNLLGLTSEMLLCMGSIHSSTLKVESYPDSDMFENDVVYLIDGSGAIQLNVDSDSFVEGMPIVTFRTSDTFSGTLTLNTIDSGFYNSNTAELTTSLMITEPGKLYVLVLLQNSTLDQSNSWFIFEPFATQVPQTTKPFYVENGYGRAYSTGDGVIQMDGYALPNAEKHPWPIAIDPNEFQLCSFIAGTPFNLNSGLLEYGNNKTNALSVTTFSNSLASSYTGSSNVHFDPIYKDEMVFVYGPGSTTSGPKDRSFYLTIYGKTGNVIRATQTLTQTISLPGVGFTSGTNFWNFSGGGLYEDASYYHIVAFYNLRYYGTDAVYHDTFVTVKITINKTTFDATITNVPHPFEFTSYGTSLGCAFGKTNTSFSNGEPLELTYLYALPYIDGTNYRTAIYGYYPERNALSLLLLSPIQTYSTAIVRSVHAESYIQDDMSLFNDVRFLRSDLSANAYIEDFAGNWVKLPSVPAAPYIGFDGNRSFIHNTGVMTSTTSSLSGAFKVETTVDLTYSCIRIVNGNPLLISTLQGTLLDSKYDLSITINGQYKYDSVNDVVYRESPIGSAYFDFAFVAQPRIATNLIHDTTVLVGKDYSTTYDFQIIKLDMGAQQVIPWKATFAKVNLR